jgi:adiponectin receptor
MVSAIACLVSSTIFHTVKDMNKEVSENFNKLDYAGISILIAGSNTSPIYYILYCDEYACKRYIY